MKTKLWEKENKTDSLIEKFTIGRDREFDLVLAPFDVKASKAHAKMLEKTGLISKAECEQLLRGLSNIDEELKAGTFKIEDGVEDIHSQIEIYLTEKYGGAGKKIHTGRSRNDQVLTAIKLYLKDELAIIEKKTLALVQLFKTLALKFNGKLLPGYTHFQAAMPSSFDMWLGAYAESLEDDLELLRAACRICDKNPLGSAAGFGSSFPIDREFTTKELGFSSMNRSPVYAQMTRGKSEKVTGIALASIAQSISRFSYDVCLYLCQNFNFISFPEKFTTGSSIMPHKKNPDVFELLRAKCNLIQSLPEQLTLLCNNLPSGYHRDMQLTKELIIPAIRQMKECQDVLLHVLPLLEVNEKCLENENYKYLFSVEEVNRLVMQGIPFRRAYELVSEQIAKNEFAPPTNIRHTHAGSIGNFNG